MNRTVLSKPVGIGLAVVAFCLMSLLLSGCAFMNRDNTPVTNAVEEKVSSASPRVQEALFPAVWPIAAATLTADVFVVHPASVVDDALYDTRDALWDNFEWDTEYASECFKLPWRAVFTPIVFGFDFLGRAMFDIEPYGHKEAAQAQADEFLAEAARQLEQDAPKQAGAVLDKISAGDIPKLTPSKKQQYYLLRLRTAYAADDYSWFRTIDWVHRSDLRNSKIWPELLEVLEKMLDSEVAHTRLTGFGFIRAWMPKQAREKYVRRQLDDSDPIIRLHALDARPAPGFSEDVMASIERMAVNDQNAIVRARAAEIVRIGKPVGEEPSS